MGGLLASLTLPAGALRDFLELLLLLGREDVLRPDAHRKGRLLDGEAGQLDRLERLYRRRFVDDGLAEDIAEVELFPVQVRLEVDEAPPVLHPDRFDLALLIGGQAHLFDDRSLLPPLAGRKTGEVHLSVQAPRRHQDERSQQNESQAAHGDGGDSWEPGSRRELGQESNTGKSASRWAKLSSRSFRNRSSAASRIVNPEATSGGGVARRGVRVHNTTTAREQATAIQCQPSSWADAENRPGWAARAWKRAMKSAEGSISG